MGTVKVLSGISGSGKSVYAGRLLNESPGVQVSADNFFFDSQGDYNYDHTKIGEAHSWCFKAYIEFLEHGSPLIVVDNTNTRTEDISPYMLGASAFGYDAEIITIVPQFWIDRQPIKDYKVVNALNASVDIDNFISMCINRNNGRAPAKVVAGQWYALSHRKLLPHWKHTFVPVGG